MGKGEPKLLSRDMLSANAGQESFDLAPIWQEHRSAMAQQTAFQARGISSYRNAPDGCLCLARVVARAPVTLMMGTVSSGERVDGVAVTEGDCVLLTAQTDVRENGLYLAGQGRYLSVSSLYVGLQVLVLQGTMCASWLFVCVSIEKISGMIAFRPVLSPGLIGCFLAPARGNHRTNTISTSRARSGFFSRLSSGHVLTGCNRRSSVAHL